MQPLDWITLALGVVLTFTGIGLAVRFARDDQDAFIHYVYTVVLGMGGGFLAASIPGWFQVDGSVAGIAIRATSGFAVFAFVVVIYYLIRTRQRVARVHAAAAWRARQNAGIKSGCTAITNCNDDPIVVCTSLPTGIAVSVFESACRDLAEVMCASVVRSIEEYCRTKTKGRTVTPSFPSRLDDWKAWAKSSSTGSKPGLPQHCLDLATTSAELGESMRIDIAKLEADGASPDEIAAARYTNRVYDGVETFGAGMMSFDIEDWHDD
jgi:hypothetical protein